MLVGNSGSEKERPALGGPLVETTVRGPLFSRRFQPNTGISVGEPRGYDMSTIKIKRAQGLAAVGKYPRTWAAIIGAIPAAVVSALSSRQLAELADAMRTQYEAGHSAGVADAC